MVTRGRVASVRGHDDGEAHWRLAAALHDLKQPLAAVTMLGAALEAQLRGTAQGPLAQGLNQAAQSLQAGIAALTSAVHAPLEPPTPQPSAVRLSDLFERLEAIYRPTADHSGLTLRFRHGNRVVFSDPALLERLLGNLIHNALHYTVRGGVCVVARAGTHRDPDGSPADAPGNIRIEVWDTGMGIAAPDLESLFTPYRRSAQAAALYPQGLGLGLSVVQRFAHELGHQLSVSSRLQRGTVFRVHLRDEAVTPP